MPHQHFSIGLIAHEEAAVLPGAVVVYSRPIELVACKCGWGALAAALPQRGAHPRQASSWCASKTSTAAATGEVELSPSCRPGRTCWVRGQLKSAGKPFFGGIENCTKNTSWVLQREYGKSEIGKGVCARGTGALHTPEVAVTASGAPWPRRARRMAACAINSVAAPRSVVNSCAPHDGVGAYRRRRANGQRGIGFISERPGWAKWHSPPW